MDTKALAKSKRAHSLHHKKKHQPHQALKAPSLGSDDKKPTGKLVKERPSQPHGQQANERPPKSHGPRPLPSNWGRYDEDFDLGSEQAQASSSLPTEFVLPKSKGADYAQLVLEAKAESQAHYSPDVVPLFDDFISDRAGDRYLYFLDFTQDFGPMLAAKGQNILSWIADDSFEFEDKTSASFEAPFLSLNLNALAEQLAKAKLSERLYLESDLLPLELLDEELQVCGEGKHDPQTCTSKAETNFIASSLSYNQEPCKNTKPHHEQASSTTVAGNIPIQTSEEGSRPRKQNVDEILQSQGTDTGISPKLVPEHVIDSTCSKPPEFEASCVEAELDMLLSSFDEAKFPGSETMTKGTHMMEPAVITGSVDDDIDNLLEETSKLSVVDDRQLPKANAETIPSIMHPDSKSKLLDDFDSWLDTI